MKNETNQNKIKGMDFYSVKKPHTNLTLVADDCFDLSSTKVVMGGTPMIYTIWECRSFWKRLKFLFNKEITLGIVSGTSQPPVTLQMGDILENVEITYQ